MNDKVTIRVIDIIGGNLCIASEDGQKVFENIVPLLKAGKHVIISFEEVSMLISLFLNTAIGQLYGTFREEQIRAQLEVAELANDDMEILQRVVENAKTYYANQKEYDNVWAAMEGNDEE